MAIFCKLADLPKENPRQNFRVWYLVDTWMLVLLLLKGSYIPQITSFCPPVRVDVSH